MALDSAPAVAGWLDATAELCAAAANEKDAALLREASLFVVHQHADLVSVAIDLERARRIIDDCKVALDQFADQPVSSRRRMTLTENILLEARKRVHAYLNKHSPTQKHIEGEDHGTR